MIKHLAALLMKEVEEYNEIASEENRLDWWNDIVDNIDMNDEESLEQAYAEVKSKIIKLKMLQRNEEKKMKRAMIFVRGKDTEIQRAICEAYAKKHGYYIKGTTDRLPYAFDRSVEYDILLTAGKTRINRYAKQYDEIVEMFDEVGIEIVIAE